jgi:glyoxylase-like metal-dependent hydrolase (beta-lactamase superfamily II)
MGSGRVPHLKEAMPIVARFIHLSAALSGFVVMAACSGDPPSLQSAPPNPAPFTVETRAGTKIHVIQTGWGATKQNGHDATGPGFLRLLSFLTDGEWTDWFPVNFYAIERSVGVVVHDTGETARIYEDGYYRCDALTEWIYLNHFRFSVAPEFELEPQLRSLGIDPATVKWAVLSHLHSDHIGGMRYLTGAEFLISRRDSGGHNGALLCRIPEWVEPTLVEYAPEPFGAFQRSHAVGGDPNLRIVPTPGHSPGHQSLMLLEGGTYYLFAGDAIFNLERAEGARDSGFAADLDAARASHETIRKQLRDFETILAPAHDYGVRDGSRFPSHVH